MRHRTLIALVVAVLVVPATAALADERPTDTGAVAVDTRPTDVRPADTGPTDLRPTGTRSTDVRPDPLRRCLAVDRPLDCCRVVDDRVLSDRCEHDGVNLRALLWRAIQAHEWALVVRILHALGII